MAKDYVLEKRKYVIGGVALAIVLIYLLRLFSLFSPLTYIYFFSIYDMMLQIGRAHV